MRILVLTTAANTSLDEYNTFDAIKALINNVENGNNTNFRYIVRYFPEGDYWFKDGTSMKLVSLRATSLGEEKTPGSSSEAYLRITKIDRTETL